MKNINNMGIIICAVIIAVSIIYGCYLIADALAGFNL